MIVICNFLKVFFSRLIKVVLCVSVSVCVCECVCVFRLQYQTLKLRDLVCNIYSSVLEYALSISKELPKFR
jgi:hypothetical protein